MSPRSFDTPESVLEDVRTEIERCDRYLTLAPSEDLDRRFVVGFENALRVLRRDPADPSNYVPVFFRAFGSWEAFSLNAAALLRSSLNRAGRGRPVYEVLSVREALEAHRERMTRALDVLARLTATAA